MAGILRIRREEEKTDRKEVFRIHQNAFQRDDECELVEKLRQNKQFNPKHSFVALLNNQIVAHLLFTPVQVNYPSSSTSVSSLALAPISVSSDYQKQGIGSHLIEYALKELRSEEIPSIIVLGHEHFYPKFGFVPARQFHIRPSFPLQNEDCFMVLELTPRSLPRDAGEGIVQYLPEFGI